MIINNKNVTTHTNSKGIANINIFLIPKKYKIAIKFAGDKYLNPCTKKLNLTVSKLSTKIKTNANYVVKKNRFYFYLIGNDWKGVPKTKVIIKFRGKTYTKTTNKNGRVSLKISSRVGKYKISAKFKGDKYFSKSSKKQNIYVTKYTRFSIGNKKLLTKGHLRIYLKGRYKSDINKKLMIIKIGNKTFKKRTNSEGRIVFKPKVKARNYTVVVKYGKYSVNKRLKCINDTPKDPLKNNITWKTRC